MLFYIEPDQQRLCDIMHKCAHNTHLYILHTVNETFLAEESLDNSEWRRTELYRTRCSETERNRTWQDGTGEYVWNGEEWRDSNDNGSKPAR